jgi:hypothetical protein
MVKSLLAKAIKGETRAATLLLNAALAGYRKSLSPSTDR